jgi:hypothetical protein
LLSCAINRSPDYQKAALLKAEAQHCPGGLLGGVKGRTYCFYQSVIVRAIENRRPHMQGCPVALWAIAEALAGFDPHAVVCSRPGSAPAGFLTRQVIPDVRIHPIREPTATVL